MVIGSARGVNITRAVQGSGVECVVVIEVVIKTDDVGKAVKDLNDTMS